MVSSILGRGRTVRSNENERRAVTRHNTKPKQTNKPYLVGDLGQADAIAGEVFIEVKPVQCGRGRFPHDRREDRRGQLRKRPFESRGYQREGLVLYAQQRERLHRFRDHLRVEAEQGIVEELGEVLRQALGLLLSGRMKGIGGCDLLHEFIQ